MMDYHVFKTEMGWVALLASEKGLIATSLTYPSAEGALEEIGEAVKGAVNSPARFRDLSRRLKDYFAGQPVSFPDEVDYTSVPPFYRKAWQAARSIPYGETRSYKWLAEAAGSPLAARAAGQAMAKNRLPIIVPCHRVTGSNGIGGFSGGISVKKRLLQLEAEAISPWTLKTFCSSTSVSHERL